MIQVSNHVPSDEHGERESKLSASFAFLSQGAIQKESHITGCSLTSFDGFPSHIGVKRAAI